LDRRHCLLQYLKPLCDEIDGRGIQPREISAGPGKAVSEPERHGIRDQYHYDWDCG
jgi:hypothetical protein